MRTYAVDVLPCLIGLVVVNIILVSAGPPDWVPAELIDMVHDDKVRCMEEHGTKQEMIDQVNDGILVNDRAISCYMHCLLEAFTLVDEDGNLEAEMLISFLPPDLQEDGTKLLNKCAKQDGADGCEKVFNVAKCVQATVPELWFIV